MIGAISRGYVGDATTKNIMLMARSRDGWGGKNVLRWGKRPAGQSCARTREIRQGG